MAELSAFITTFAGLFPMSEEDIIAIRRRSGFLPDVLPDEDEAMDIEEDEPDDEPEPEESDDDDSEDGKGEEESEDDDDSELALRPLVVSKDEKPTDVMYLAPVTPEDVTKAMNAFNRWAKENDPRMAEWLDAEVLPEEGE